ncbi:hypothetical protein [Donghicola tyrosinivorans]|nr:hypothetical protein [Donghicola tyrosinivorans]
MDLVRELAEDIRAAMLEGHTLTDIVAALNANRDADQQINPQTFRNYLQKARAEQGLAPVQPKRAQPTQTRPVKTNSKFVQPEPTARPHTRPDAHVARQIPTQKTNGRNMKGDL